MSTAAWMAILLPIIALILVGFFFTVWRKEKTRSDETSHDTRRLHTDTDGRGTSGDDPTNPAQPRT
jgi:hypothetical protein